MPSSPGLCDSALTIVPPILPGETILSHVMRMALMSASSSVKPMAAKLFGLSTIQPPLIIPSNLTQYVRKTEPVFTDVDEVVRDHTLYPILEPFLSSEARATITNHLWNGSAAKSVFAYLGFANKSSASQVTLGMCVECVVEDEALYGVAFWHREHQLPAVSSCGHHATALVGGCRTCAFSVTSSRVARLPRSACWCGKPHAQLERLSSDLSKDADARMSRMLVEALRAPPPKAMRPEDWCGLYNARARELGYGRGRHLATPAFEADFVNQFGEELLNHYGAFGRQGCLWLRRAITQVAPFASCLKHFLVADFLYGSWDEYCDAALRYLAQRAPAALTGGPKKRPAVSTGDKVIRERHRTTIRKFMLSQPGATRTKVRLGCGEAFNFLVQFDVKWLYDFLPSQRNRSFRGLPSSAQYLLALDEELLGHVRTKHALLVHPDTRPRRITRSALLVDAARGQEAVAGKFILPKLELFLYAAIETKLQYQVRRATWIFRHPLCVPDGLSALQFSAKSTGLPQARILDALSKMELASQCE